MALVEMLSGTGWLGDNRETNGDTSGQAETGGAGPGQAPAEQEATVVSDRCGDRFRAGDRRKKR